MTPDAASKGKGPHVVGEARWPMAFAVLAVIVLTLLIPYDLRRITQADLPELRAIEVLAIIVPLFLFLFASLYLTMSHTSAAAFSEPLDHTGALYFAVTIFSTVGFGDITPRTDLARVVVSVQMLLDLVLLGVLVRLLVKAARSGLSRGQG